MSAFATAPGHGPASILSDARKVHLVIEGLVVCSVPRFEQSVRESQLADLARAYNAHNAMVKALEAALPYVTRVSGSNPTQPANLKRALDAKKVADQVRDALAGAGAK